MSAALGVLVLLMSGYMMVPAGAAYYWLVCIAFGWFLPLLGARMGGRSLAQTLIWTGFIMCGAWVAVTARYPSFYWAGAGAIAFAAGQLIRNAVWPARVALH